MNKKIILSCVWLLAALPLAAQIQKFCIPGVVPSHHVTSFELAPGITVADDDGGVSTTTLTGKLYYAFSPEYNIGIEVPVARFESPDKSANGLGDVLLSAQAVHSSHRVDLGFKMETFLPTATDKTLGTGKWVLSPAVYGVLAANDNFFFAAGYKQYFSAAGDGGRPDLNYGRLRVLAAYLDDDQWWITFDPQYYMDYKNSGQAELVWESEIGVMVNPGASIYIKPGAHLGGNWKTRDWTLNMGFKILYL